MANLFKSGGGNGPKCDSGSFTPSSSSEDYFVELGYKPSKVAVITASGSTRYFMFYDKDLSTQVSYRSMASSPGYTTAYADKTNSTSECVYLSDTGFYVTIPYRVLHHWFAIG